MLFQMTSNEFYAQFEPRAILGHPVDVAFIDGQHLCESVLQDLINTEAVMSEGSIILLHDLLPLNATMAERARSSTSEDDEYRTWWTGDAWKVAFVLRRLRPDLEVVFLDCPPTGLVMITRLSPQNRVLADSGQEMLDEIIGWELDESRREELFSVYPMVATEGFEPQRLTRFLDAWRIRPYGSGRSGGERRAPGPPPSATASRDLNHLEAFFKRHEGRVIHKWMHYFEIYERHFAPYRGRAPVVVEVGVGEGGSLQMWKDYLGKARESSA